MRASGSILLLTVIQVAFAQPPGGGGDGGGRPGGGGGGGGGGPPGGGGGGRPGGGGGNRIQCSLTEQYVGEPSDTPRPAPLRGNVGCIDLAAHALRDYNAMPIRQGQDGVNIYGPMEAGFSSRQFDCLGDQNISGGLDTNLAEHMVEYLCPQNNNNIQVLDACGGHAVPYHYHERMSCLYTADPVTGHSTRIGTAGDGNGIYGKHIDGGIEPKDLDACGGRFGVTPDSNGEVVYYYSITSSAPFSVGCYGPVSSVQECRDLYPDTCGESATIESVTTIYGTGLYTLDCPCFDWDQSNVIGQGRPGYLAPLPDSLVLVEEAASNFTEAYNGTLPASASNNSLSAEVDSLQITINGVAAEKTSTEETEKQEEFSTISVLESVSSATTRPGRVSSYTAVISLFTSLFAWFIL